MLGAGWAIAMQNLIWQSHVKNTTAWSTLATSLAH
jgi:hypothetical protein